ncbi:hypothetical protein [Halioxenophilus aromaticivorans]|uniref:hypothetical protein n=1 Tax=Halioxenophilus aromaticivorans TaxID=1306992 RepID=UPI0031EFCC30
MTKPTNGTGVSTQTLAMPNDILAIAITDFYSARFKARLVGDKANVTSYHRQPFIKGV